MDTEVAIAAPSTSISSFPTRIRSNKIFMPHATNKNKREDMLSPKPRKIPAFILYPIFPIVPSKTKLI